MLSYVIVMELKRLKMIATQKQNQLNKGLSGSQSNEDDGEDIKDGNGHLKS